MWFSDDITFCANKKCKDKSCYRNPKNIKHRGIPHSFSMFIQCEKWSDDGAEWLMEQCPEWVDMDKKED